jgi:hypothetical protein
MSPKTKFLQMLVQRGNRGWYFALLILGAEAAGNTDYLKKIRLK